MEGLIFSSEYQRIEMHTVTASKMTKVLSVYKIKTEHIKNFLYSLSVHSLMPQKHVLWKEY